MIKSDQNTLPNKSRNPESLEKILYHLESSSTNLHIVGKDLLRAFYKLLYLRFCVSSDQWKRHRVAKTSQEIWERFLYEINRNYNFHKFSYKFTFIPLMSFHRNQKQESNFQQVGGGLVARNSFAFSL